ncbi:hypothetical protein, partial [Pandoraea sputorum]|uniref:hypothetical protein n=1 Tax=Pandoraea sputorum TaxID=93222 RepID=UPI0035587ABD
AKGDALRRLTIRPTKPGRWIYSDGQRVDSRNSQAQAVRIFSEISFKRKRGILQSGGFSSQKPAFLPSPKPARIAVTKPWPLAFNVV